MTNVVVFEAQPSFLHLLFCLLCKHTQRGKHNLLQSKIAFTTCATFFTTSGLCIEDAKAQVVCFCAREIEDFKEGCALFCSFEA